MGRMRKVDVSNESTDISPKIRPAQTDEERLNHCIAMAYDVVEERLANRTASAQEVCHFLKLATEQSKLEAIKLQNENTLTLAKVDALRAQEQQMTDYNLVIQQLTKYNGQAVL